jgi:hypothetical protein
LKLEEDFETKQGFVDSENSLVSALVFKFNPRMQIFRKVLSLRMELPPTRLLLPPSPIKYQMKSESVKAHLISHSRVMRERDEKMKRLQRNVT